eukprot:123229_1
MDASDYPLRPNILAVKIVLWTVTSVTIVTGFISLAAIFHRRAIQPIKVRYLSLISAIVIFACAYSFVSTYTEINYLTVSCFLKINVPDMMLIFGFDFYLTRLCLLWVRHLNNRRKVHGSTKPPSRFEGMLNCVCDHDRWILTLCSILLCTVVIMAVAPLSVTAWSDMMQSESHFRNGACPISEGNWYLGLFVIVNGLFMIFASCRFVHLDDAFFLKGELKLAGLLSVIGFPVSKVLKYTSHQTRVEIFPFSALARTCLMLSAVVITGALPVYLSFSPEMNGFCSELSEQIEEVELSANKKKRSSAQTCLEYILHCPEYKAAFKAHLMREFCVESLLFWEDATEFYNAVCCCELSNDVLHEKSRILIDRYIRKGAETEVNISFIMRKQVIQNFEDPTLNSYHKLFEPVLKEMMRLMRGDSLRRYRRSKFAHPGA